MPSPPLQNYISKIPLQGNLPPFVRCLFYKFHLPAGALPSIPQNRPLAEERYPLTQLPATHRLGTGGARTNILCQYAWAGGAPHTNRHPARPIMPTSKD